MGITLGNQYMADDEFKAKARLHQSQFRAEVLQVSCSDYGNRLKDKDGRKYLNYYDGLGVLHSKHARYPEYSKGRDADMLRSEHIPFNLFPPLGRDRQLAKLIIRKAFGIECEEITAVECEWAPNPKENFLGDMTSFDAYVAYVRKEGQRGGIGIEVKYTEREYKIGKTEKNRVEDKSSTYWTTTRNSGAFIDGGSEALGSDALRQIWRNHLLGLAMVQRSDLDEFYSVTLYPAGNRHFAEVIPQYQALLSEPHRRFVFCCTFEQFFDSIKGNEEVERWKAYLKRRYIVD